MTGQRSQKQERDQLVRSLRAEGRSWVVVAETVRERYRVNARVALRYAHGWSQRRAADEWNQRWPDEPKTLKMFSYWELWPSSTGHAPSFTTREGWRSSTSVPSVTYWRTCPITVTWIQRLTGRQRRCRRVQMPSLYCRTMPKQYGRQRAVSSCQRTLLHYWCNT